MMRWPSDWPLAHGRTPGGATIRANLTDFKVREELDFSADGEGEHALLRIEKIDQNTADVVQQIASLAGVPASVIGFCGMKDRRAVTSQYFSVGLAGVAEPDWSKLEGSHLTVLEVSRHRRKLRRGGHARNCFELVLRDLKDDPEQIEARCETLQQCGVPNYFGAQRFGRSGGNLWKAERWMASGKAPRGRTQRGMVLSSARSWLFNECLASLVKNQRWFQPDSGDICILNGSRSFFLVDEGGADLQKRHDSGDIHLAVPLWGEGESGWANDPILVENAELAQWLCGQRLKMEYRSARLLPNDFTWQFCDDGSLHLQFCLPPGGFATAVVQELITMNESG